MGIDRSRTKSFYGWRLLFFLWMAYTIPIGFAFYSPAVLYPVMIRDLGWSRGEIMTGSTAILLLLGLAAPLTAWMIGRFGSRATLALGGTIVASASLLMGWFGHVFPTELALSIAWVGAAVSVVAILFCTPPSPKGAP